PTWRGASSSRSLTVPGSSDRLRHCFLLRRVRSSPDRNCAVSRTGSILSRANQDRRSAASLNLLLRRPFHGTARTGMLTASEESVRDVTFLEAVHAGECDFEDNKRDAAEAVRRGICD